MFVDVDFQDSAGRSSPPTMWVPEWTPSHEAWRQVPLPAHLPQPPHSQLQEEAKAPATMPDDRSEPNTQKPQGDSQSVTQ